MISFKSKIAVRVLGYFFANPDKRHYINELAEILSLDPGNLHRKLKELEKEGVAVYEEKGNQKYYFLNKKYPLLHEVKKIFEAEHGVPQSIKKELFGLKGLKEAYIFGSYAKNSLQQESDIDLLLVGDHSSIEAKRRLLPLQKAIGRDINVVDMGQEEFSQAKQKNDPFIKNIFSDKIIEVITNV